MRAVARAWLPSQALERRSIEAAIEKVMTSWGRSWFGRSLDISIGASLGDSYGDPIEQIGGGDVVIDVDRDALVAIGAQCGGLDPDRLTTKFDRSLCMKVGQAALSDAHRRLLELSGDPRPQSTILANTNEHSLRRHRLHVSAKQAGWAFLIDIVGSAIIALRRAQCRPTTANTQITNDALATALSFQSVTVGAKLGSARLPIASARDLSIGDVVIRVLESRRLSVHADLCLVRCNGQDYLIACGASGIVVVDQSDSPTASCSDDDGTEP